MFLMVGVLRFVLGITANFDQLQLAGHHSEAKLLGLFQVSTLHNIVHLLYGGIIYLVLFVCGLLVPQDSAGNFVPLNGFDNGRHLLGLPTKASG